MSDPALVQTGPIPMDQFNKAYCLVCANRECSRSGLNLSAFDRRAINWKSDLFDNVVRPSESDPQYQSVRSKQFLPVARHGGEVNTHTSPVRFETVVQEMPTVVEHPVESPVVVVPVPAETKGPKPAPITPPALENTPFIQGTMLPGAPSPAPQTPQTPGDIIISPGGSFTFGGSDD